MGYNGDYLEGIVINAKKAMNSIKKYKTFNLSLLQERDINSMKDRVNSACDTIKSIDFDRYRSARRYSNKTTVSRLDHFLTIDDILYNDEANIAIGIDWTVNPNEMLSKVDKHKRLKEAILQVVDITCVVYVEYEEVLDELSSAELAKAIYKMLKKIDKAVSKKDFAGYLTIDAQTLT